MSGALRQEYIHMGTIANIHSALTNSGTSGAVPDDGRLIGVWVHVDASPDANVTIEFIKNGADFGSASDIILPSTLVANTGAYYALPTPVPFVQGERLHLRTVGEGSSTTAAFINGVFDR